MIKLKDLLTEIGLWNPPEDTDNKSIPDLRTIPQGSKRRQYNAARKWIDTKMKNKSPAAKEYARQYMFWKIGGKDEPNARGVRSALVIKITLDRIFEIKEDQYIDHEKTDVDAILNPNTDDSFERSKKWAGSMEIT